MQTIKISLMLSSISLGLVSLVGCSSMLSSKMPPGSVSMAQTYNSAINGTDGDSTTGDGSITQVRSQVKSLSSVAPNYTDYTQTQENQINNLFPLLPNPNVVMYVYPHLAGIDNSQSPVPGYSTVFPLYTQVNYAMPGERVAI